MLRTEIKVRTEADRLLYEGLPHLRPVLKQLGDKALLIGGLAAAAWLNERPVGLPVRPTRDVDLGIDRVALGTNRNRATIQPLLKEHKFEPGFGDEEFRFWTPTEHGPFVVDLLVAPGASRRDPPLVESGLPSLAAPGLAYGLLRGPVQFELVLLGKERRRFRFTTVQLDALFVMKATLTAGGLRPRADRRQADTVDSVMLAAACLQDDAAMDALVAHRRRSDVRAAVKWIGQKFESPRSAEARRVEAYTGAREGAVWSVEVAQRFVSRLAA